MGRKQPFGRGGRPFSRSEPWPLVYERPARCSAPDGGRLVQSASAAAQDGDAACAGGPAIDPHPMGEGEKAAAVSGGRLSRPRPANATRRTN